MNKTTTLVLAASLAILLAACGRDDDPPPAPAAPPTPGAATAPPANTVGQGVYNRTCALCHAAGVAGAPKPGDRADWEPRIAQGMDVLYQHSIDGFTGSKGFMPPRGGNASLSDDEIKAAVDFMVEQSR